MFYEKVYIADIDTVSIRSAVLLKPWSGCRIAYSGVN